MQPHRRIAILALVLLFSPLSHQRQAHADLFGGDVAELASILAELVSQGLQLANQLDQLQNQVRYAEQNLRRLDPSSLTGLINTFNTLRWTYQSVQAQAQALGFTSAAVQNDFNRLFPSSKDKWHSVNPSQFDSYYTTWQTQISSSSAVAMSAQTQIDLLKRQNDTMVDILRQSQAADGALKQLQLVNQSLAKIHDVLATGARVSSSVAAAGANERLMGRESKLRRLDGYTNRGRPPQLLNKLP
jgi:P-type conjugative transfer protein TrbJ